MNRLLFDAVYQVNRLVRCSPGVWLVCHGGVCRRPHICHQDVQKEPRES